MSDLSQLMQVAPITGAGFMGINQADNEQEHTMRMMELQELMRQRASQEQRNAAAHPLEMQAKQLGIQRTEAELPGILAQSQSYQSKARVDQATENSKINGEKHKQIGKAFEAIGALAPNTQNAQQLQGELQSLGVPQEAIRMMMSRLGQLSGPALQKEMTRISENYLRSNPDYVKERDRERLQQEGADRRNAATIETIQFRRTTDPLQRLV